MGKATDFINMFEAAMDPEVIKVVDQLSDAFIKAGFGGIRTSDTGNLRDKMYRIVNGKDGNPYAEFNVPVIVLERGESTDNRTYHAQNSNQNFRKIMGDLQGKFRAKGWYFSQPVGGRGAGDDQNYGTIMQFFVGKPAQEQ